MASLGDLIPSLSTSLNIFNGTSFTSLPFLTSEFNSYSITMYTDVITSVTINWSSDGIHWDYDQSYGFAGGIANEVAFPVLNKWIQIIITNNSGANSTFLRFSAYASPANFAIQTIVPANVTINTLLRSAFSYSENGNLMTATNDPYQQYNFNYGTGTVAGNFQSGYLDLTATSTGKGSAQIYSFNSGNTGSLKLFDFGPNGTLAFLYSNDCAPWMPSVGLEMTFSASYSLNQTNGSSVSGMSTLYCGAGSVFSTLGPGEGIFLGFYGNTSYNAISTPQNLMFGLIYISQANPTLTFIPQRSWNLDNCSGVFTMPNITTWAAYNQFKLNILQDGNVLLSIMNPKNGVFVPCHYLNFANTAYPSFRYPFFGFRIYQSNTTATTTFDNSGLSINNWSLTYQNNPIPRYITHYSPISYTASISASQGPPSTALIYTLINPKTWNGLPNFLNLYIDFMSAGYLSNNPSFISIYKNLSISGGVTGVIDQYNSPSQIYTTLPTLNSIPTNSLFSQVVPVLGQLNAASTWNLNKYNIRVFPGETLSLVLYVYIGNGSVYPNVSGTIGFHQVH